MGAEGTCGGRERLVGGREDVLGQRLVVGRGEYWLPILLEAVSYLCSVFPHHLPGRAPELAADHIPLRPPALHFLTARLHSVSRHSPAHREPAVPRTGPGSQQAQVKYLLNNE